MSLGSWIRESERELARAFRVPASLTHCLSPKVRTRGVVIAVADAPAGSSPSKPIGFAGLAPTRLRSFVRRHRQPVSWNNVRRSAEQPAPENLDPDPASRLAHLLL